MADIQKAKSDKPIKNGGIFVNEQLNVTDKDNVGILVQEILDAPAGASITGTWTCPDNVLKIKVECWGQGGRGGTMIAVANTAAGGGGGGAYASSYFDVVPGVAYQYSVGNAQSSTSLSSWFSGTNILLADRGRAGVAGSAVPGAGGYPTGCIGEVIVQGDAGQSGTALDTVSPLIDTGYYGGGGGNGGNGGGLGAPRNTVSPSGGGSVGGVPGGGGSGGKRTSAGTALGGYGGAGRIVITYNKPAPNLAIDITTIQDKYTERFDDEGYYG